MTCSYMCAANYWEGGPPIVEADRIENSLPFLFSKFLAQRGTAYIKDLDKFVPCCPLRSFDT